MFPNQIPSCQAEGKPTYQAALVKQVDESSKGEKHVDHQHHSQEPDEAGVRPRLRPAVEAWRHRWWWRRWQAGVVGVYHDASRGAGGEKIDRGEYETNEMC